MTKRLSGLVLSMVLSLALSVTLLPQGVFAVEQNADADAVKSDGIIVVFDEGTKDSKIESIIENSDAETEQIISVGEEKLALANVDSEENHEAVMEVLEENKKVLFTQPNYIYKAMDDDPQLSPEPEINKRRYQYQFNLMKVKEAWGLVGEGTGEPTKVAVLDTGVDKKHVELKENISEYKRSIAGEIVDGDVDTGSHGTHVTGIIGATYGNGKGGAGIASGPNNNYSDIMVVGISEDGEYMTTYNIVAGLKYAAENGARVVNMSFGGDVRDRITNAVIKWAHYEKGIVFVAAAGNDGADILSMPADIKEVISVCNCNSKGYKNKSSSFGIEEDVTAPGTSIPSTIPGGFYGKKSGTSMSSPMVAGVCALMLDANPDLTPDQVRNIICATAVRDNGNSTNYYLNNGLGYGLIDAEAAVDAAIDAKTNPTSSVESIEIKTDAEDPIFVIPAEGTASDVIYEGIIEGYRDVGFGLETLITPVHSSAKVTWESEDPNIAQVDENGVVVGKTPGESTTITATADGKSASCTVQVYGGKEPTGVEFDLQESDKTMYIGDTSECLVNHVRIIPRDAINHELYWTSSNPNVIIVDDEGYLTARSEGEATITACTYNGVKSEGIKFRVLGPPAKIEITKSESWLKAGEKSTFKAVVKDSGGGVLNDCNVEWESGNQYLASVNSEGQVTAKAPGGVYIFAKISWPSSEKSEISVYKKVLITKKNYFGKDYSLKCTKAKAKKVTLKWKKIPKAGGYQLYRATKKKGKYKHIKSLPATKASYVDKKTKAGKTYFYKVRAKYTKSGKTGVYGYSNIVKAKIKKAKK